MKNVYMIGDMVRYCTDANIGYGIFVMEELEGEAYVYSPQDDCRSAQYTLRHLHLWADCGYLKPEEIDVVHWNNGLWDCVRIMDDDPIVPIAVYQQQLVRVYKRITQLFPNAKVIFGTTTPVVERKYGLERHRNSDIEEYNRAAIEVLVPLGVKINDLYATAARFDESLYRTYEYFSIEGAKILGRQVADAMRSCF